MDLGACTFCRENRCDFNKDKWHQLPLPVWRICPFRDVFSWKVILCTPAPPTRPVWQISQFFDVYLEMYFGTNFCRKLTQILFLQDFLVWNSPLFFISKIIFTGIFCLSQNYCEFCIKVPVSPTNVCQNSLVSTRDVWLMSLSNKPCY